MNLYCGSTGNKWAVGLISYSLIMAYVLVSSFWTVCNTQKGLITVRYLTRQLIWYTNREIWRDDAVSLALCLKFADTRVICWRASHRTALTFDSASLYRAVRR